MPKRQRPRHIPTPVWEERPRGRVRRELGARLYLVAVFVGLVVLAGAFIVFAFVKDYLDERALPGSTAIAVEDRSYDLDYFAARLRLYNETTGGGSVTLENVDIVADQLVAEETVRRFSDELDVSVTAEEVEAELAALIDIAEEDPNFDFSYQAELDRIGFTEEEHRQIVEVGLLVNKVRERLGADIPAEVEQVRYSLIQVDTDAEAQQVLARLQAGEDFAALARELSTDARTRDQGGELGWLAKGLADRALEDTLFSRAPGSISDDPFPFSDSFLVFQVLEKEVRPLDDTQRLQVGAQDFQRWLEEKQQSLEIVNYVDADSEKLDIEKLQWVFEHG